MLFIFYGASYCIFAFSGILIAFVLSITNTTLFDMTPGEAFFIGIGIGLPALLWLRFARNTGWFGEKYFVTPEHIEKVLPNGKTVSGHWKDLVFTPRNVGFLGFEDGTLITINLLFRELKPEQLEVVLNYAGDGNPLAMAYRNYEQFDYGLNRGFALVLMKVSLSALLLAIVPLLAVFTFDAVPHDKKGIVIGVSMFLLMIGAIGFFALTIPFIIKRFHWNAADRKEFRRLTGKQAGM